MKTTLKTRDMVISALLIAIGILIPMIFTFPPFRIYVPPFSATLMAHVPVIIAMFISPWTSVFTTIGTAIGFFFSVSDPTVAVRAASHIIFALMGVILLKKGMRAVPLCILTGIVHAISEGVVVMIFLTAGFSTAKDGFSVEAMVYTTIIGTFLHHCVDFAIAYAVGKGLARAKMLPAMPPLW